MRPLTIVYVAKHGSGGNDDEGAVAYALEQLGHTVVRVHESAAGGIDRETYGDFLLCHHWHALLYLERVRIPKVFWCFDLIDWPGGGLRHEQRRRWVAEMTRICDVGFLTDGDWVARAASPKLNWLPQGADERPLPVKAGYLELPRTTDVLFVGGLGYGREKFVAELRKKYGDRFRHVLKGCHGAALADEVRQAKIVVAPDSPVTDLYWSNRVYNVLRLGGFLIHPWSDGLSGHYNPYLLTYRPGELIEVIDRWLPDDAARQKVARVGYQWTMQRHTYRHRLEILVAKVRELL